MKNHLTLSIDADLLEIAKEKIKNLSEFFESKINEFLVCPEKSEESEDIKKIMGIIGGFQEKFGRKPSFDEIRRIYEEPDINLLKARYPEIFEQMQDFWKSPFGIETLKKNRERDRCQGRQDMQKE